MKVEKLLRQKEKLEEQIKLAEQAAKNKNRVERLVLKELAKQPAVYSIPLETLQANLVDAFEAMIAKVEV